MTFSRSTSAPMPSGNDVPSIDIPVRQSGPQLPTTIRCLVVGGLPPEELRFRCSAPHIGTRPSGPDIPDAITSALAAEQGAPTLESVLADFARNACLMNFADAAYARWRGAIIGSGFATIRANRLVRRDPQSATKAASTTKDRPSARSTDRPDESIGPDGFPAVEMAPPDGVSGQLRLDVSASEGVAVKATVLNMQAYPTGCTPPARPSRQRAGVRLSISGPEQDPLPGQIPMRGARSRHRSSIVDATCPYVTLILSNGFPDSVARDIHFKAHSRASQRSRAASSRCRAGGPQS